MILKLNVIFECRYKNHNLISLLWAVLLQGSLVVSQYFVQNCTTHGSTCQYIRIYPDCYADFLHLLYEGCFTMCFNGAACHISSRRQGLEQVQGALYMSLKHQATSVDLGTSKRRIGKEFCCTSSSHCVSHIKQNDSGEHFYKETEWFDKVPLKR